MTPAEDCLDDIGCQEGQGQDTADVSLIDAVPLGECLDAANLAGLQVSEPSMGRCDGLDKGPIRSGSSIRFALNNDLGLEPAAFKGDGDFKCYVFDVSAYGTD